MIAKETKQKIARAGLKGAAKVITMPEQYVQHVKEHSYKKGVRAGKLSTLPWLAGVALISLAIGSQLPRLFHKK